MSLWWSAAKHFLKTMIPRRLTLFWKLVIVFFVMGLKRSFKVRVAKCRLDERDGRTRWIRLTLLCTLVIFLVVTCIREIFTVRAPTRRSDDKEEKQAKKDYYDYYEVSDSVLQTEFLVGSNSLQWQFHRKSSKMWLWWKAKKNKVKTKIWRRVKCFSQISWFLVCIFTIRA